jgi:formiminoglutamase
MKPVEFVEGDGPLVLAAPHAGTSVPEDIFARLNARGRELADTDWHVDRLYDGLVSGATRVRANFHRYVVDANRDPSGASLYPGENTTGLVPLTDFDGAPIWEKGAEPDAAEIEDRRVRYHAPYHAALAAQLERVKAKWGVAVLYDCHSIRSRIPYLFEGRLPDLNIGTNSGASCSPALESAVVEACAAQDKYSYVLNGRFKGGWTTRVYGGCDRNVQSLQMEVSQVCYLDTEEAPFLYSEEKAYPLRKLLGEILEEIDRLARSGALGR